MPTKAEIARDWATSPEYVIKCCKRGCPTESFENARDWRKAHASSRAPTSSRQIAKQVAEEKDHNPPESPERREAYFRDKPNHTRLPSGESMDDVLFNARQAAIEASRLLSESMDEGRDNKIGIRLSVHSKATEAYFKAEEAYRAEQERRQVLIPIATAQEITRKAFDVILSRLASLPQNLAVRCNPQDPHTAMDALEAECNVILLDAQKAIL